MVGIDGASFSFSFSFSLTGTCAFFSFSNSLSRRMNDRIDNEMFNSSLSLSAEYVSYVAYFKPFFSSFLSDS